MSHVTNLKTQVKRGARARVGRPMPATVTKAWGSAAYPKSCVRHHNEHLLQAATRAQTHIDE